MKFSKLLNVILVSMLFLSLDAHAAGVWRGKAKIVSLEVNYDYFGRGKSGEG